MAAVTICSDFGAPENKVWHCFHCFPIYFPWSHKFYWIRAPLLWPHLTLITSLKAPSPNIATLHHIYVRASVWISGRHRCSVHMCMCVLNCVWLFATPWTVAHWAPLSTGSSKQKYWSGLPFPALGDLPDPGIESASLASPELAGRFFTTVPPGKLSQYIVSQSVSQ